MVGQLSKTQSTYADYKIFNYKLSGKNKRQLLFLITSFTHCLKTVEKIRVSMQI